MPGKELSYTAKHAGQAKRAFSQHVIRRAPMKGQRPPMAWHLARPGTGNMAVDIIMADHYIVVNGDACKVVCFSRFSPEATSIDDAVGVMSWLGGSTSWGYIFEKAQLGTNNIHIDDHDEARKDLQRLIDEYDPENGDSAYGETTEKAVYEEALDRIDDDTPLDEIRQDLCGAIQDGSEYLYDVGRVVHDDVYRAHAALARLYTLLQHQDGDDAQYPHKAART